MGSNAGPASFFSTTAEAALFMCTDANDNIYTLSRINNGTAYADTFSGITYGSYQNILVSSYNCAGQMRWAKLITASGGNCSAFGITADSLGHIYIAGYMSSSVLHIGDVSVTGHLYQTQALVQLDTVGNFYWIRYLGDNVSATFSLGLNEGAVCVDSNENVHFLVALQAGMHLTPSLYTQLGNYDIMYDPAGNMISARRLLFDSTLLMKGAFIDRSSNKVYVHGARNGRFWNNNGGTPPGDSTASSFISSFDTNRNLIWIDTIGTGYNATGIFSGLTGDCAGNLYASGTGWILFHFLGNTFYGPASPTTTYLSFILKIDTTGSLKWLRLANGGYSAGYWGLTLAGINKIAAVGRFGGSLTTGGKTIQSPLECPFLSVIDTAGYVVDLQRIHGNGTYNYGRSITADLIGNIYVGGSVSDTIPDTLITAYHSVGGFTDFFVAKYGVDCGCTAMPAANYTYTLTGLNTVSATYTGTTAGIDSVVWYFGDGTKTYGLTANHTYTMIGSVDMCVIVYTSCGRDTKYYTFLVNCTGTPASSFNWSGSLPVSFSYTGTTLALDSVKWTYGDGGKGIGTSPTHIYSVSGTYTVCATAHTACGNNTACNTITVNCTPVSSFTSSGSSLISLTYTGTTAGLDSVVWTYGDGNKGTGLTPTHAYAASGTYTVCATVYTKCGSNTACNTVTVSCTPVASFTHSGVLPVSFTYTGSIIGIDSVKWSFGDGGTATGLSPSHAYTSIGTYTVCATVYTSCGTDVHCDTVNIPCTSLPVAAFTDTGTHTFGFTYSGTTTAIDSVVWNFGDGNIATGLTAIHHYATADTYHVCATAYNPCGSDSVCHEVIRSSVGIPVVNFADIKVYPNPAKEELMVTGIVSNTAYRLLSITGMSLHQGVLRVGTNSISIKDFAPGIYILEMTEVSGVRNMVRVVKE